MQKEILFILIGLINCCSPTGLFSQGKIKTETRTIFHGVIENSWETRINHFNEDGLLIKEETSLGGLYFRSVYTYDNKNRILSKEMLALRGKKDTTLFSKIKFEYQFKGDSEKEFRFEYVESALEPRKIYESCTYYLDENLAVIDSQFLFFVKGKDTTIVTKKYFYNYENLSIIKTKRFYNKGCSEMIRLFNYKGKDSLVLSFDCKKGVIGNLTAKDSIIWDGNLKKVLHLGSEGRVIYSSTFQYNDRDSVVSLTLREGDMELFIKKKKYDKLERLVELSEDDFDESRKVTLYSYVNNLKVSRSVYRFYLFEDYPNPVFEERIDYQYTFWDE